MKEKTKHDRTLTLTLNKGKTSQGKTNQSKTREGKARKKRQENLLFRGIQQNVQQQILMNICKESPCQTLGSSTQK
jgi:hypothetical protein